VIPILISAFALLLLVGLFWIIWFRLRPRKLKVTRFQTKWQELQKKCANKDLWNQVVVDADDLLGEALKKKHVRGHTIGERLVNVQRDLTDNDAVWFAHKLRNKIDADPSIKLKESDVKQALIGVRQALKDLGAL